MARGIVLRNNLTKDTLLTLARIGGFAIALTSPYFLPAIVNRYFKEKTKKATLKRARKLRELEKRKLVEFNHQQDGSVKITLSHRGKTIIHQYQLDDMKIKKLLRWDKTWRIIMYDIPHQQRMASNAFRQKIKSLGLYPIQKSIWASPYPCYNEIEFLCSVFEINMETSVFYFETTTIPKEKEMKIYFNL